MVDRISSGVRILDEALQGGYPIGSVISLFGTTTNIRKTIAFKFLIDDRSNHNEVEQEVEMTTHQLYINTRDTVSHIKKEARLRGIDFDNTLFLDAVNWRNKRVNPKQKTEAEFEVSNLTDLNSLLAKIMEAGKKYNIDRVLFDSPSSLLLYTTPGKEQVYKFFELLTSYFRNNQITLCYTLEQHVHPTQIVSTMHFLSDGVIEIGNESREGEYNDYIQVHQMSLTNFLRDPQQIPPEK